jgi:hypothetical protein
MNIYDLIYLGTYDFFLWLRKEDDPEFRAVIGFSLIIISNLLLLSFVLKIPDIMEEYFDKKIFYICTAILVIIINYFIYIFRGRYEVLYNNFLKRGNKHRLLIRWTSFFLIIEALILPIVFGFTGGFGLLW